MVRVLVPLVLGIIYAGIVVWWVVRRFRRASPRWICRRLQQTGHVEMTVPMGGTWNPAKPFGLNNPANGVGRAYYELGEDGIVYLTINEKSGRVQHFHGPLPVFRPTPATRRVRLLAWTIVMIYVLAAVAGFAVGYAVSTGSRFVAGLVGAFAALVIVAVLSHVVVVVVGAARRRSET